MDGQIDKQVDGQTDRTNKAKCKMLSIGKSE